MLTVAHRICVQGRAGDDTICKGYIQGHTGDTCNRVYSGSVQGQIGDVQGMTVKAQALTGEDGGFSYGHGVL